MRRQLDGREQLLVTAVEAGWRTLLDRRVPRQRPEISLDYHAPGRPLGADFRAEPYNYGEKAVFAYEAAFRVPNQVRVKVAVGISRDYLDLEDCQRSREAHPRQQPNGPMRELKVICEIAPNDEVPKLVMIANLKDPAAAVMSLECSLTNARSYAASYLANEIRDLPEGKSGENLAAKMERELNTEGREVITINHSPKLILVTRSFEPWCTANLLINAGELTKDGREETLAVLLAMNEALGYFVAT